MRWKIVKCGEIKCFNTEVTEITEKITEEKELMRYWDQEDYVGVKRGDIFVDQVGSTISRRRLLQSAGGIFAGAAFPTRGAAAAALPVSQVAPKAASKGDGDVTGRLARYLVA